MEMEDNNTMNPSATLYFQSLSDLLLNMQVTVGDGSPLSLDEGTREATDMILAAKLAGSKVLVIGNGGSAAIAGHMHNDLCKAVGVRAMVFHELPLLTALTNDHGYGCVFERPLELWADPGDLLFAISSSGQSENILRAVRAALARDCQVITFSGFKVDNPLRSMGHLNFYVPSQFYGQVETAHSVLSHFLTDCVMLSVGRGSTEK